MKAIKLIPLLLLLAITSKQNFSIDTVSTKYLPLKVGNVWVYSYSNGGYGVVRIKIITTQNSNNHTYYVFQKDGDPCYCEGSTYSPFLTQMLPMRIDSINGNLMFYGTSCQWQINEHMLDSLRRTKIVVGIDSSNNTCNNTQLFDTSQQIVFGVSRKTKEIGQSINRGTYSRRYAKDIGLISSIQECYFYGNCTYTLLGCVANNVLYGDTSFPVGINKISSGIPNFFELSQNYPNPFNPKTIIEYKLPESGFVNLSVYDNLGNKIVELVNEKQQAGSYKAEFDGTSFASGVYYYRLSTTGGTVSFSDSKKMVLIK